MLKTGIAWALGQLLANEGETITYRRASVSTTLTMIFSSPRTQLQDGEGFTFEWQGADFQCRASDLKLSNVVTLPQRGDLIERIVNGATKTYEVQPVTGEQPYTLIADQKLRIHTKER